MPDGACVGQGAGKRSIHLQWDNPAKVRRRSKRAQEHPITTCQAHGSPSPLPERSAKCQEKSWEGTTKVHAAPEPSWLMSHETGRIHGYHQKGRWRFPAPCLDPANLSYESRTPQGKADLRTRRYIKHALNSLFLSLQTSGLGVLLPFLSLACPCPLGIIC